jgi:hypothetical protein
MIISDLNYLEVLAEETNIVGGLGEPITVIPGFTIATGNAESIALGQTTFTQSLVKTESAAGVGSKSTASGVSVAA